MSFAAWHRRCTGRSAGARASVNPRKASNFMIRARRRSSIMLLAIGGAAALVVWSGGKAAADEKPDSEPTESDFSNPPGRTIEDGWSNYDLGPLTFKWGLYSILDFGNAFQSDESAEQVEVEKGYKIRDFR